MTAFPVRSIVIVGTGSTAWLAAAALAKVLGASCAVRVVDGGTSAPAPHALASVPSLHRFLRLLGLDEVTLLRATRATYRLGTSFVGWRAPEHRYFQGFDAIGARFDAVPFHQHWLRVRAAGGCPALDDFSVAALAAAARRFGFAPDARSPPLPYAWHFDADLLTAFLREHALRLGAAVVAGRVASVEIGDTGEVRALQLAGSTRIEADFFIDCTGELARSQGVESEDWSAWLPCDRLQTLRTAAEPDPAPCSEARAESFGWSLRIPLQDASVRGAVYSSGLVDDASLSERLAHGTGPAGLPRVVSLARARPREFWTGNCLWLAGDALDPLESTALHLAQTGVTRFLAHFPARLPSPPDCAEYNRLTAEEYDRLRDLLVVHYHATARTDSALWSRCRTMALPASLAQRLALFADSGRLTIGEDEHCALEGWLAVLAGQGVEPRARDPLADQVPLDTARAALAALAAQTRARAQALPPHREFLARRGMA